MEKFNTQELLADLNDPHKEYKAIRKLRQNLGVKLAGLLLDKYRRERKWDVRCLCVFHCIRFSRESDDAFTLGIAALSDKSKVVRYRACMLLAYSLREDALQDLNKLVSETKVESTKADAIAAIDAINNQNHNYFIDRNHTGKMFLNVN